MLAPRLTSFLLGFSLLTLCVTYGAHAQLAPDPAAGSEPLAQSGPAADSSAAAEASPPAAASEAMEQSAPVSPSDAGEQSAPAEQSAPPEASADRSSPTATPEPAAPQTPVADQDNELNSGGAGAARLLLPPQAIPPAIAATPTPVATAPARPAPPVVKAPEPNAPARAVAAAPQAPITGPSWLRGCKSVQRQGTAIMCDADSLLAEPSDRVQVYVKDPGLVPRSGGMTVRESLPTRFRLFYLP